MPIKVTCPICNKISHRKPSHADNVCCSNECGQKLRSLNAKNLRAELKETYERLYLKEKKSLREISKIVGYDSRTIRRAFAELGIKSRKGSEAVALQWVGNTKRKKDASNMMKKIQHALGRDGVRHSAYRKKVITRSHRKWSKEVRRRDGFACAQCKLVDVRNNNAHHIKSALDFPELALELSNGITLCKRCHSLVHVNKLSLNSMDSSKS